MNQDLNDLKRIILHNPVVVKVSLFFIKYCCKKKSLILKKK